nr:MAG TPA: hypothetical protein [Caudoviricetes sp.]DAU99028.1 MAG TPA: hypothetical protein [Bacteriophage sp.]
MKSPINTKLFTHLLSGLGPRCRRFKSCHLDQKRWFFNRLLFFAKIT